jgi:hypothetical protein
MCGFCHTRNPIHLVTATKYTAFGVIEYRVFPKHRIDCSTTTNGVVKAMAAVVTGETGRRRSPLF